MGDVPLGDLPATALFARLGVVTAQLGIDGFQLESARKQLTSAVNEYARVWLDADATRIALRTTAPQPPLARPGTVYVELQTNPDTGRPDGTLLVVGSRPLDEDLPLLGTALPRLEPAMLDTLANTLPRTVDVLGQRTIAGEITWLLGFELGADSVGLVTALAEAVRVQPYHAMMIGALHEELAAHGCLVTVACSQRAIRQELAIEYRDLEWARVVTTTAHIRRTQSGGAFGVLAGGFNAERAAYFEITLGRDQVPGARAAIEQR